MTPEKYKELSIKEFTQAAQIYDSGHAGIYEMCKDDYPPILTELEKGLSNTEFLVGDSENLPFAEGAFDAVICANSFHHYPNPQDFFNSACRVLCKGGRLILRDYTASDFVVWLMNHLEMPLANLCGHGDVRIRKPAEFVAMAEKAGFTVLTMEKQKGFRAHLVARK